MPHRILVLGATGRTGKLIVSEALAAGHQITAFARDPAKAAGLGSGVGIVIGDVKNAASVEAAVAGHDTVLLALAPNINAAATRAAIAGLKRAGGRRIVALSAYGTGDSRHGLQGWIMNVPMGSVTRDKVAMEAALAASGLDWTAVRPPALSNGPKTGRVKVDASNATVNGFARFSRADLAAYMVGIVDDRSTFGKTPVISQA